MLVRDTDKGRELQSQINELRELLYAYRHGMIKPRRWDNAICPFLSFAEAFFAKISFTKEYGEFSKHVSEHIINNMKDNLTFVDSTEPQQDKAIWTKICENCYDNTWLRPGNALILHPQSGTIRQPPLRREGRIRWQENNDKIATRQSSVKVVKSTRDIKKSRNSEDLNRKPGKTKNSL